METSSGAFKLNFSILFKITIFFLIVHFFLNYFASPLVLQNYIILTALVLIGVLLCDLQDSMTLIFVHFFIEGQGRIVFGYNPVARVMFDLLVCVYIAKHIVINKRIVPLEGMPKFISILITIHFLVFFITLFNSMGVGFVTNFPMIKVYILPFIMFFLFLNTKMDFKSLAFNRMVKTIIWMIVMNGVLCIKQFNENTPMMVSMSPYYLEIGKLSSFTNLTFRPFGTTFIPGGISTYLYLTLGIIFLGSPSWILFSLGTAFSIVSLILCQVRTALIQYIMMYGTFMLFNFRYREKSLKTGLGALGILGFVILFLAGLVYWVKSNPNEKLVDLTFNRMATVFDTSTISKSRMGFMDITQVIIYKLQDNPLGLGPGRTHTITEAMGNAIDRDPVYDLNYGWNYDNLWVTIAIEFGYLGIFYALLILSMPLYLFSMTFTALRRKNYFELRVLFIATVTTTIIVLANWGGVGIPYNPVSFMFWFWCALGFRAHYQTKTVST